MWEAINECKYIFIKTAFIGDSAYLLEAVCEAALRKKIKDKFIINFRYSSDRLYASQRGLRMLQILQARNNIKYISQDTEEFDEISKKLFL